MSRTTPRTLVDVKDFDFVKLTRENRPELDCTDRNGEDSQRLQMFIDKRALKNQDAHLGTTHVIMYKKMPIGYITLATSYIHKDRVFKKARPSTRDGNIYPALAILDFCIDKPSRGMTYGEYALMWVKGLVRRISKYAGCRYVVLYSKDPDAIRFYERNNYQIAEEDKDRREEATFMYFDVFLHQRK